MHASQVTTSKRAFTIPTTLAVFVVLFLCAAPSPAQQTQQAQASASTAAATSSCAVTFTANTGNKLLQFCVTANGNVTQLQTPAGHEFINFGHVNEGYGICNESPATAYWDYADQGDSGNWGPPSAPTVGNASAKITRSTADGIYTLTQTFTIDKNTPAVRMTMALKNNTAVARRAYLVRFADIDADPDYLHNNFDGTANSASGWSSTTGNLDGWGIVLQNTGPRWGYVNGFGQPGYLGPNPCAFANNWPGGLVANTDGSIVLAYADTINAHATKTASMMYRGF